jgi:hypothetical protein
MTRYFFHLHQCGSLTDDPEGAELPDLEAARLTAITAARDVMGGELTAGVICFSCHIEIADADGRVLLAAPFKDAVRVSGW